ncbi:hypothetical protein BDR03DRAFT_972052 [Suillus americanus]|nr:hypothetical protein BDR03DRAFT_972052 [Suillus americanus]
MHSVLTHILFQIRPHLPALTRLPRTWTLLCSLGQREHAIFCRCWTIVSHRRLLATLVQLFIIIKSSLPHC